MKRSDKGFRVSMWHGTTDDLQQIVTICQDLRADAVQHRERELESKKANLATEHRLSTERLIQLMSHPDIRFENQAAKELFKKYVGILRDESDPSKSSYRIISEEIEIDELSMRVYDQSATGEEQENSPELILSRIQPSATKILEIKFGSPFRNPSLSIRFERNLGVTVKASSSDFTWSAGAIAQLKPALQRGKPWYAFAASHWVSIPLSLFLSFIICSRINIFLGIPTDNVLFWSTIPFALAPAFYALWAHVVFRRFELVSSGKKPLIATIGAILVVVLGSLPWESFA